MAAFLLYDSGQICDMTRASDMAATSPPRHSPLEGERALNMTSILPASDNRALVSAPMGVHALEDASAFRVGATSGRFAVSSVSTLSH